MAVNPFTPDLRPASGEFGFYQSIKAPGDVVWTNDASKIVSQDEKAFLQGSFAASQCESFSSHDPDDPRLYQKSWYFANRSGNMGNISGTSNFRPHFDSPSTMTLSVFQDPQQLPFQQLQQQQNYGNHRHSSNSHNNNNNNNIIKPNSIQSQNIPQVPQPKAFVKSNNPTPAPNGLIQKQTNFFNIFRNNNKNNNNDNKNQINSNVRQSGPAAPTTMTFNMGLSNNPSNDSSRSNQSNKTNQGSHSHESVDSINTINSNNSNNSNNNNNKEENDEKSSSISQQFGKSSGNLLNQQTQSNHNNNNNNNSNNSNNNSTNKKFKFTLSKLRPNNSNNKNNNNNNNNDNDKDNENDFETESVASKTNLLKEFQLSIMSAVSSISNLAISLEPTLTDFRNSYNNTNQSQNNKTVKDDNKDKVDTIKSNREQQPQMTSFSDNQIDTNVISDSVTAAAKRTILSQLERRRSFPGNSNSNGNVNVDFRESQELKQVASKKNNLPSAMSITMSKISKCHIFITLELNNNNNNANRLNNDCHKMFNVFVSEFSKQYSNILLIESKFINFDKEKENNKENEDENENNRENKNEKKESKLLICRIYFQINLFDINKINLEKFKSWVYLFENIATDTISWWKDGTTVKNVNLSEYIPKK